MAPIPYTLTGASDWPMLVAILKFMAWVIGGSFGVVAALVSAMWWDTRKQYAERCERCSAARDRESEALWDTLEICCPREAKAKRPIRCKRKEEKSS